MDIELYLRTKFYPSFPESDIPVLVELGHLAIDAVNADDHQMMIEWPTNLIIQPRSMQDGYVSAAWLVDALHLENFCTWRWR